MAKRVLVAAALLLVLFAAAWFGTPAPEPADDAPSRAAAGDVVREAAERTARGAAPKRAARAASADAIPAPVDLDRCDRDLDLFGVVVDADGKGIAGATLATVTYPWSRSVTLNIRDEYVEVAGSATRSASDGTFAIRLTRGANVALRVAADGFAQIELSTVVAGERMRIVLRPCVRLVVALTDASGAPVGDASVRLVYVGHPDRLNGGVNADAGADGVATFDGLPAGAAIQVLPTCPRGSAGWTSITLPASGELRREIRFPASRMLTGTVVDAETRRPIEGATVGRGWPVLNPVKTRADGSFELADRDRTEPVELDVLASGYGREAKTVDAAGRADFEMRRGYAVTGRVVGADASPVEGATVSLFGADLTAQPQLFEFEFATTGADGRFRVGGLRAGVAHALAVGAAGFARLAREAPAGAAGDDVALGDLVLAAPHRIEGVAIGPYGAAQAHMPVTLAGPATDWGPRDNWHGHSVRAVTDDLGRFRFDDLAPGTYTLTAGVDDRMGGTSVDGTAVVPETGDALDVRLVAEPQRDVVVTVVDTEGAPVTDEYVGYAQRSLAQTDAQGRARIAVPVGAKVDILVMPASSQSRAFFPAPQRELGTDESAVTIVLEEGVAVTGRLVDPAGAPVAFASFEFRGPGDARIPAETDADGRFRTLVHRDGRSTLVFDGRVKRGNDTKYSGLAANVDGVASGSDLLVRCERVATDRTMTVVVLSPSGDPVAGAVVQFWDPLTAAATRSVTDAAGRAAFEHLPAREVYLGVALKGAEFVAPAGVRAVPAGQELRMTCRNGTRITGIVVDESGTPQPGGVVVALRGDMGLARAQVGDGGRFTLLLPMQETAPVRLTIERRPDVALDAVAPGTQDVRLVVRK